MWLGVQTLASPKAQWAQAGVIIGITPHLLLSGHLMPTLVSQQLLLLTGPLDGANIQDAS